MVGDSDLLRSPLPRIRVHISRPVKRKEFWFDECSPFLVCSSVSVCSIEIWEKVEGIKLQ